jgi:hypothetical protein
MRAKSSSKHSASASKRPAARKASVKKSAAAKPKVKKAAAPKKSTKKQPEVLQQVAPNTRSVRIKVEVPSLESLKIGTGKIQSLRKFKKSLGWWY